MESIIDDETLIDLVHQNENLYNKSSKYKSLFAKETAWKKISKELDVSEAKCRRRWTTLRDRYTRECRIREKRPESGVVDDEGWHLFDRMNFLRKHIKARPTRSVDNTFDEQSRICSPSQNSTMLTFSQLSQSPSQSFSLLTSTSGKLLGEKVSFLPSTSTQVLVKKSSPRSVHKKSSKEEKMLKEEYVYEYDRGDQEKISNMNCTDDNSRDSTSTSNKNDEVQNFDPIFLNETQSEVPPLKRQKNTSVLQVKSLCDMIMADLQDVSEDLFFEAKWKILDILRVVHKKHLKEKKNSKRSNCSLLDMGDNSTIDV